MLLLSDPSVAAVPVHDLGEPLVDVRELGLALDHRKADPQGSWARVREGVGRRLVRAQQLLPEGFSLLVVECHRPAALQQRYFDEHCAELAAARPGRSAEQVAIEASRHISPPAVAPHPCGAAVDLTLAVDGRELDLGTRVNATPDESDEACFTAATNIPAEARRLRDVLGAAMSGAGLVNYPPEWWHWSFGDRYWATVTGAPAALYAPT
ncbi:M15 family metallopeptidase [Aeromicrobium duanguangcaii]|uniref:M15 family metallopeptidase n=1 Tax=Aeromicrobium duanguangcaii TaxID=2968086 RepID=UPI002017274A|nr:M15 family metallopeptidase [Aeromicrobium duanguangcaii]MCL3838087.1 M15 family metallopeptidase [Aeromicrobium duanguangcaii]